MSVLKQFWETGQIGCIKQENILDILMYIIEINNLSHLIHAE